MHNGSSKEPDYRILFDSIPGLYLVLSPASGFPIVAVSSGLLQATATRREDLVGHSLLDAFADNPAEAGISGFVNLGNALQRVLWSRIPNTLPAQKFAIRRPAEAGGGFEERLWGVQSSPVLDSQDALQYIICSIQDMSASRRATEPESLPEEWVAMVAHDLQQPVHALVLGTDLLRRQVPDEKTRRSVERVRASALRLSRMIQDLWAIAKLESRQLSLQPEPMALGAFVRELLHHHPDAAERVTLQLQTKDELQVLADGERVAQVLSNLVTNAVRFSDPGTAIRIEVTLHPPFAQLAVISQGPAIAQDELLALFDHCIGVERSHSALPGASIGLYVAKGLIEAHGGRIWAESGGPHATTRFCFTLPLDPQADSRLGPETRPGAAEPLAHAVSA